jgi:hypothetical protein
MPAGLFGALVACAVLWLHHSSSLVSTACKTKLVELACCNTCSRQTDLPPVVSVPVVSLIFKAPSSYCCCCCCGAAVHPGRQLVA